MTRIERGTVVDAASDASNVDAAGKPQRIEDRTFRFAVAVVKACDHMSRKTGCLRTLSGQLIRSGTSIGANVEEAQAAQSHADFISKMNIALKEAREAHYWFRVFAESGLTSLPNLKALTREALEISLILGAIVRTARNNAIKKPRRETVPTSDAPPCPGPARTPPS